MINSNLDAILHSLATIHSWQTGRQTDGRTDGRQPWQQLDRY